MTTVAIVNNGKLQLRHTSLAALAKLVEKISDVKRVTFTKNHGSWIAEVTV